MKLRVIDEEGKVQYGDNTAEHVFKSESYQKYIAVFEHESSIFTPSLCSKEEFSFDKDIIDSNFYKSLQPKQTDEADYIDVDH